MKINKDLLSKALNVAKAGLAAKEMIEQSTSFAFKDGYVITYNDEICVHYPVEGLELEGAVTAKEFQAFVNKAKTEEIDITTSESQILLKAGRSRAGLTLQEEVRLPLEEVERDEDNWKKLPEDFAEALGFAASTCSRDMSRPVLTCVHINGKTVEGTDSYRCAQYTLSKKTSLKGVLIPASVCIDVCRLNPVEVSINDSWIHFKTEDEAIISCRLFDEEFVDIASVMEQDGLDIEFPDNTLEVLERAKVFTAGDTVLDEAVEVILSKGKIVLKSKNAGGWFEEKMRANCKVKEDVSFLVTPYTLQSILNKTNKGILIGTSKLVFVGEDWIYLTMLRGA